MNPVFVEFEATSLGPDARPIEIGLCDQDGVFEAYLIQPEPGWHDWDAEHAKIHGITEAEIARFGHSAREVANRVRAILLSAGTAYTRDVVRKAVLLDELLKAGDSDFRQYPLRGYGELMWRECEAIERAGVRAASSIIAEALKNGHRRDVPRHRAGPTSRTLWWRWQEVRRLVRAEGG